MFNDLGRAFTHCKTNVGIDINHESQQTAHTITHMHLRSHAHAHVPVSRMRMCLYHICIMRAPRDTSFDPDAPLLPHTRSRHKLHIRAAGPHLRGSLAVPAPAEHIGAGLEAGRNLDDVPYRALVIRA